MLKQRNAPQTLSEAIRYFADADTAFEFVVHVRWPDDRVVCPRCSGEAPTLIRTRRLWKCRECKKQFSVKVGTIFEDSALGFDKWLPALWMLANAKNGVSSYEVHRALAVTQKTAWFMMHRIRLAMRTASFEKVSGTVEVDEGFIGGKRGNMHREKQQRVAKITGTAHMAAVMGMPERKRSDKHSTVRVDCLPNTRRHELEKRIRANIAQGSELFSDAHPSYERLAAKNLRDVYTHAAVDHAVKYVDGQVHTNGLENFWSLLKRSIKGTFVSVDPFHRFRYLDEQAFRFNARKANDRERFMDVLRSVLGKRLTYARLITDDLTPATT